MTFWQHTPTAPRATCRRAISAHLWVLAWGRSLTPVPHPRDGAQLVVSGVYAHARHPIYGGLLLTGFGWALVSASPLALALSLVLAGFFWLKSGREEAWLRQRYAGYADYAVGTKRFVPYGY